MSATPDKSTSLAELRKDLAVRDPQSQYQTPVVMGFTNSLGFELLQRAAKALAASSLVPEIYVNNIPNCMIALEMAQRIGASPLMVMQNMFVIHNRPAWSAKFLIACFNQCGRFSAVRYLWSGTRDKDDWGCQAWSIERETQEKILGPVITLKLTKEEGWYGKKDSKWKTMPEKMFMYRAAAWMIDTHAPELSMGIRTEDEVHDTYDATKGPDGRYAVNTEDLRRVDRQVEEATGKNRQPVRGTYTVEGAKQSLNEAGDLATLEAAWRDIMDIHPLDQDLEVSVEALYKFRKESLSKVS